MKDVNTLLRAALVQYNQYNIINGVWDCALEVQNEIAHLRVKYMPSGCTFHSFATNLHTNFETLWNQTLKLFKPVDIMPFVINAPGYLQLTI